MLIKPHPMRTKILVLFVFFALGAAKAQNPILVSAQWLKEHKNDPGVVVLQVNFMKLDYDQEHLEGARYLWPGWLAPDSPEGAMNIPDLAVANEIISSLGISNDSHIILCHVRNEVSPTTRMFLMFEYLGMKGKISFLNGGLEAWKKEGNQITKDLPVVKATKFKSKVNPVIVDKNYVLAHLSSDTTLIVDARATRFYDGEPTGNPRDGHIAGAKNIVFTEMIDPNNFFKPVDQLQTYFTPVAGKDKELVTYCFIGQTASVVYMAGRILGYQMKLYDGSMQEWSRIKELPMEMTVKK